MPAKTTSPKSEIFVTMGDPAGVGPEIIARAFGSMDHSSDVRFTIIGDKDILDRALARQGVSGRGNVDVLDCWEALSGVEPGKPSKEGARKSLRSIEKAVELMMAPGDISPKALVTGPISKEAVAEVSCGFTGHTEFLQKAYGADLVTMAFVGDNLRVVPVTRHIPLKDVSSKLSIDLILNTIRQVVENGWLMTGVDRPRVMVTALNPHAGEGGRMGTEEKDIIGPAVLRAREIYPYVEGPIPSDVAFYKALGKPEVIVLAMYHDQCLGPFKMLDFTNGVNMTLGLGHVRTSPDHGTAFDIAGKGIADPGSMIRAIELALKAVRRKS
jgi:4-hydroxythreonine-4-phosphate dehydrogenase